MSGGPKTDPCDVLFHQAVQVMQRTREQAARAVAAHENAKRMVRAMMTARETGLEEAAKVEAALGYPKRERRSKPRPAVIRVPLVPSPPETV